MASLTPTQYYTYVLNVVSGNEGMHALQYKAAPKSGETIYRGNIISIDNNGQWQNGLYSQNSMPCWAITGNTSTDLDVEADVGNISGGVIAAFVATGGYEIFTTQYFSTATYGEQDLLTACTATANLGKVTLSPTVYNDMEVVGCVSKGVQTDIYSQSVLYFWPMFIPKVKLTALT